MSDAIHPHGVAKQRPSITVVKTGPFVVRHLAPGKPFLKFKDGKYVLVYPKNPDEMPSLPISERLRYRINQWLISRQANWHVPPLKLYPASVPITRKGNSAPPAVSRSPASTQAKVPGRMRASVIAVAKAMGKGALIAFLGFMALMGVTRFVHVDVQTVFHSVHFGIPHFLTPWRKEDDPVDQALHGQPNAFPAIPYYPTITPSAFTAPADDEHSPKARDDAHMARDAAKGWLPLPGGGPFPMNMPSYGDDGQQGPIRLKIHPPTFNSPDDQDDGEGSGDAVTLLGATPAPVTTPTPVAAPAEPEPTHVAPRKETGPRVLVIHSAREAPREANRPAPQPRPQPVLQPPQQSRDTVDVQLMAVPTQAPSVTTLQPSDGSQQPQQQSASGDGPAVPKFNVITKNGDALVVMEHGQMKQVSVGQSLPDGSTLLSVQQHGGGFSTSRGNYVAY